MIGNTVFHLRNNEKPEQLKEGEKEKAIRKENECEKEKKVKKTWSLPIQPHTQQEEVFMIQPPPPHHTFSIFHLLKVDVTKH